MTVGVIATASAAAPTASSKPIAAIRLAAVLTAAAREPIATFRSAAALNATSVPIAALRLIAAPTAASELIVARHLVPPDGAPAG